MTEDVPRTPEGDLIRRARDRAVPKLSIRAAAARIGISPEHWGNIERGYKSAGANEEPRRLDTSPALIAKMASAVGVTPAQLAGAGREDAARELEEILPQAAPPGPASPPRRDVDFSAGNPEVLHPWQQAVLRQLYAALGIADRFGPGDVPDPAEIPGAPEALASLPGTLVFGRKNEIDTWDDRHLSLNEKVGVIAVSRQLIARMDEQDRRRTGLITGNYPATGAVHALVSVGGRAVRASS